MERFCEQIGPLFNFIEQFLVVIAIVVTPIYDLYLKVFVIFILKIVDFLLFLCYFILLLVE